MCFAFTNLIRWSGIPQTERCFGGNFAANGGKKPDVICGIQMTGDFLCFLLYNIICGISNVFENNLYLFFGVKNAQLLCLFAKADVHVNKNGGKHKKAVDRGILM